MAISDNDDSGQRRPGTYPYEIPIRTPSRGYIDPNSTAPSVVMGRNTNGAPKVLSLLRDMKFSILFKFFKYDKDVVYAISNDTSANYGLKTYAAENYQTVVNISTAAGTAAQVLFAPQALAVDIASGRRLGSTAGAIGRGAGALGVAATDLVSGGGFNDRLRDRQANILQKPLSTIELPIPANLVENFQISYENSALHLTGKTIVDMWVNGMPDLGNMGENLDRLATEAADNIKNTLSDSVRNAIDIIGGKVKNPVYVLMFKGIGLRTHDFSWRIVPESQEETYAIEAIINQFKRHSLPAFEKSGEIDLLGYPDFCKIELTPNIYSFPKPCFVTNLTINRSPDNIPAFHHNHKPVAYELTLSIGETTAVSREDYPELYE